MSKMAKSDNGRTMFWCPGCQEHHWIDSTWQITGGDVAPTFSPSVLVTSGHYVPGFVPGKDCWCTYNANHPTEPSHFSCRRCHSFVRSGQIEFLSDCTHQLAGQTVPMSDLEAVR